MVIATFAVLLISQVCAELVSETRACGILRLPCPEASFRRPEASEARVVEAAGTGTILEPIPRHTHLSTQHSRTHRTTSTIALIGTSWYLAQFAGKPPETHSSQWQRCAPL